MLKGSKEPVSQSLRKVSECLKKFVIDFTHNEDIIIIFSPLKSRARKPVIIGLTQYSASYFTAAIKLDL